MGLGKGQWGENALLLLKLFVAALLIRIVLINLGYGGYIPILDDAYDLLMNGLERVAGASGNIPLQRRYSPW
ncbi:MAG: hypothetical protein K1X83_13525 [Oligoflexia bacterium]|nr:hypothetical protein [Oligoflexia bacterium]